MIRFVCGRSGSGKSKYIMDALRSMGNTGESIILIVPERQAVSWEGKTARELPAEILLSLEVLTFTRLSDRVAREYGGFMHNCADKAAKQLIMWAALERERPFLDYYSSASSDKLVPALLKTVRELSTYGVKPRNLLTAAEQLKNGDPTEKLLSRKLSDISLIYAKYQQMLHARFDDGDELQGHTATAVNKNSFFKGKHVFVDSFYSYTPPQREIIEAAMRDAASVTVTFSCPAGPTSEPQFRHIKEHLDRFRPFAKEYGVEMIELESNDRFHTEALRELERGLWDFTKKGSCLSPDGIKLIETKDRFAEGEAVASEICRLVRDGARYSEIAVIARNMDSLEGITDVALTKRGIPHYTSRRRKLSGSPASMLIAAIMRVPAYGWRREDLIAIVKTGLLSLDDRDCELFERYLNMWRIRGRGAFSSEFGMNPFGYKGSSEERAAEVLDAVNRVREKLYDPLSVFCDIFNGQGVTAEKCASELYNLLTEWKVPDTMRDTAVRLREMGYNTEAAEELQMWGALMDILDTLATSIPKPEEYGDTANEDTTGDAESFSAMLSQIISATDVGTIPTGIDEVAIGSADVMRTYGVKHVIIVGAVADEFPAKLPTDGILSQTDRVVLEGCGIELSDSGRNASGMELFLFYRAVSAASHSVTLMIPRTSGGTKCTPSLGVTRIRELFPNIETKLYDPDSVKEAVWVKSDLERFLRRPDGIGEAARRFLPEYADIPLYGEGTDFDSAKEQIPRETFRDIYGETVNLSQSRIDSFAKCPFMYAANYTLGLEEDAEGKIDTGDTGTFVHKILEEFFRETADMEFPIPEDIERQICDRLFDNYVKSLAAKGKIGGRQRFLFKRLRRSIGVFIRSLNEEFTQSLFRPWQFEQTVGMEGRDSIPAPLFRLSDGTEIRMRGVIDRVDVYRRDGTTYVRVVDYKTGAKNFKLRDIYDGLNLQLLLYLFTIWKSPPGEFRKALSGGGEIIPAGALYFSARPGEGKSDALVYGDEGMDIATGAVSRNGLVLSDKNIIAAMDREFSGKYAPAKLNKDGELKKSDSLADMEHFGKLYLDIADVITEIGERMTGGCAGAVPMERGRETPCEFCPYMPVCRRSKKNTSDAEFEAEEGD